MRNTLLKIGEMAELNHVSTQTLRLYSKNKLLEPQYMDPETGYRYYTLEQCAKLDLIRALKSCHLPLGKIREIFELSSEERLLQVLEEQIGALSEEIYNSSVSRNNLLRIRRNIQTLNALPPFGQVFFEYDRNVKHYKPYSNDLSCEVSEFQDVHNGSEGMMYSFVPDPTGEKRNVLMINCKSLLKEASNMRQQFSLAKYPLTYFKDRIKFFLPEDMKEAMLSYPKAITWFSIQGSWCNFGSSTGQKTDMYSGSANSFGISKPAPDSKELYFHLLCRRRHCDVNIGLENYDDLNDELSSFLVKAGEWITIEREWKVGNPGICNHTIIDSEGRHEFYVNAYNSVCDPENEPERYADRYAGTNPYNVCFPFICKLYTSKELAQYCIDMIGSCYLYYKDYELIEAENVNALNKE